jgi:hypothetical protein
VVDTEVDYIAVVVVGTVADDIVVAVVDTVVVVDYIVVEQQLVDSLMVVNLHLFVVMNNMNLIDLRSFFIFVYF